MLPVQIPKSGPALIITCCGILQLNFTIPESPSTEEDGAIARQQIEEIGPGASKSFNVNLPLRVKDGRLFGNGFQLNLHIEIDYEDGIHKGDKTERGMYCATIPVKTPSEIIPLKLCNTKITEYGPDGKQIKSH